MGLNNLSRPACNNNPILEYWAQIESGAEIAGQKITDLYRRLAKEVQDTDGEWIYDEGRANHAITFIERYCKHSKGRWGGQPLKLELWERALIAAAFGFIDPVTGQRRYIEVLLIVARKNGKSTLAAAVGLYLMIADGEPGAEVYCTATKKDQAKIIWLEAKRMVNKSMALRRRIKTLVAEMVGLGPYDGCIMKPLGADSDTQDGLNVHGATMDEIHAWPGMDLYNVVVDGTTAREQPMIFITTTAGFVRNGLYDELYADAANSINDIEGCKNERQLAVIYELDSPAEVRDERMWKKANPGLGTIKDPRKLREKVALALRNPRRMANLLCKDFNLPSTTDEAWLSFEQIDNAATFDVAELKNCYAIGGCDLSATTDLSCATLMVRPSATNETIYVLQQYFIPETRVEAIEANGKTREAPYRAWAERGLLTICPGNQVDKSEVTEWFAKMRDEYGIYPLWIGYDRALAGYWLEDMDAHGFTYMGKEHPANVMVRVAQGAYTWSQPMKEMGAALEAKKINYNNNPMLKWCLSNTRAKSKNADGIETIEPKKMHEKQRIDGMVSLLNAYVVYVSRQNEYMEYVRRVEIGRGSKNI